MFLLLAAMFCVSIQFFNNWCISKGNLKLAYPLIILLSVVNILLDIYLCYIHPDQFGILMYVVSNIWAIGMAIKGIMRLREDKRKMLA